MVKRKRGENRCAQHTYTTKTNQIHTHTQTRIHIHERYALMTWYKCSNHIQNAEQHISSRLTAMTKPNRDRSHTTRSIWKWYCFAAGDEVILSFSLGVFYSHRLFVPSFRRTFFSTHLRCNVDTVDCIYGSRSFTFCFMRDMTRYCLNFSVHNAPIVDYKLSGRFNLKISQQNAVTIFR